jgi:putative ABC transport system permease protein
MTLRDAPRFSLRLLLHERGRLIASIGGITFTLSLMFLQLGFRNALLDSSVALIRHIDADIIVMDAEKIPFLRRKPMPDVRLYQALAAEGVASSRPLWLNVLEWRNRADDTLHPIRVIGIDPRQSSLLIDGLEDQLHLLLQPDTALVDTRSRGSYGPMHMGEIQIWQRMLNLVGTFELGADFEVDGSLIIAEDTYMPMRHVQPGKVELAAVKVHPGVDVDGVVAELRANLPGDVAVYSKQGLIERDLEYWRRGTPISIILLVGVALGFAVGVVICYQILYTDVLDHLAEFATLKAMGYSDRYIEFVVLVEAWTLSVLGFCAAIAVGSAVLKLLDWLSGLPTSLAASDAIAVGLLSLFMCSLAALLALRKIRLLDPAELF